MFKAAVEYSRTIGYNFITPEHIAIGLFTFDDGSADRVFKRQCCSRPSARKIRSLASNCSSTNSSWKSIMVNDDTKPCISSAANKLNLRKNSCSRIVHFNYNDNSKMANEYGIKDTLENEKEFENLSLIRRQLVQIENQQSNLLELHQRFTGSSRKGMSSLQKRVDRLERVQDEISQDLAMPSVRMQGSEGRGNTCCICYLSF